MKDESLQKPTRWLCVLVLAVVQRNDVMAEKPQVPQLKEAYALRTGTHQGHVAIDARERKAQIGDLYQVDVRFTNTGGGADFYNTFYIPLYPQPAVLAIFDTQGNYVDDLLAFTRGSMVGVSGRTWTHVPGGAYVGTLLGFRAGFGGGRSKRLLPGKYKLQMIYFEQWISPKIEDTDIRHAERLAQWYKDLNLREVCRSNILEIEFIDE